MTAIEWDVFSLPPNGAATPPTYLATLYEAREKTIRVELDGTGSGTFAINHTATECTEAILAQGNLVKVRIPEIHSDYIFAFFIETGDFTLISSDEAGGEMLHFGGRGNLSYLEYAVAWAFSYITGGQSPKDGVWRAYLAGTGHKPGQILMRMIEEMQDPDRPQFPIPLLTPDFDYTLDSNGDAWTDPDATDEFSYQVGEDGLAILTRLIPTGVTVQMDPDFTLHAYNTLGRDLAGDAFGAGVVRFVKGVNIATELRRELQPSLGKTHELVAGESDKYGRGVLPGADAMVTKETYLAAFGTVTATLNAIGVADLKEKAAVSDTIMFPIANRRTADVVLDSPVSIGSPLGPVATDGFYLPGPPTSDNGDFWVGDTIRVHTGSGAFDYSEVDARVMAITISRDDDNAELIVIPELRVQPTPITTVYAVLLRSRSDIYPITWPDGWTTDLSYEIVGPSPFYRSAIDIGHGPATDSVTVMHDPPFADTLGNSYCMFVFEVTGAEGVSIEHLGHIGTEYVFPDTTTVGEALLLAVMTRITSAAPYSNPASGWTDVPGFFQQEPLGDRQSVNAETRVVSGAGTYGGGQDPEGVEAADASAVAVIAFAGPATIARKGTSGILRGVSHTLTVPLA